MSAYNPTKRKCNLAKIHLAVQSLKLGDAGYRLILSEMFGVLSAANLTEAQHNNLLGAFEDRGWRPAAKAKPKPAPDAPKFRAECEAMGGKIAAMLKQARRPWNYAHALAKRMFAVDRIEWLNPDQLHKAVSALAIDQKRISKRGARKNARA